MRDNQLRRRAHSKRNQHISELLQLSLRVNGRQVERKVEPRLLLTDLLRYELRLTGTHVGCEHGVCGACTVLLDGEAVRACLVLAIQAQGRSVRTVESLASAEGGLNSLQEAFREHHALQCGFCTPGFLMTLEAFLAEHPDPSEEEVREALSGNLCRCTGYQNIVAAVLSAAASRRGETPSTAPAGALGDTQPSAPQSD